MNLKKFALTYWTIAVLVLLIIPAFSALFFMGFPITDDGDWMIIRFSSFYQEIINGQFPVRFLTRLNSGYGYPVANFLYPGFMYFAVPIKAVGFTFIDTIKIVTSISFLASGIFVYLWLSKKFDRLAAFAGALIFTYLPYHLFDLYSRGSVGELFSFIWVAFCLWMIEVRNLFLLSIGIALLAISHNTIFLLFLPFLFVYALLAKKIKPKGLVLSFVLGVLMSSFFTIPAFFELSYTNFLTTQISEVSKYTAGAELVGLASLIITLLSCAVYILRKKKDFLTLFFIVISILTLIMASDLTKLLWQFIPSSFIQFPFRLLSVSLFTSAYLAAYIIVSSPKYKYYMFAAVLILILASYNFILPKNVSSQVDSFYSTNEATTTVKDEYMPKWVMEKPAGHPAQKASVVKGKGNVSNIIQNADFVSFDFDSDTPAVVRLETIYYPGWVAYSNGVQKAIFHNNNKGLMDLKLTSGQQKIVFKFQETNGRLAADIISLLAFAASAVIFLKYKNEFT